MRLFINDNNNTKNNNNNNNNNKPYNNVINWLRTVISFELLRSVHACVRGSRVPFRNIGDSLDDCRINVATAGI